MLIKYTLIVINVEGSVKNSSILNIKIPFQSNNVLFFAMVIALMSLYL